MQLNELHSDGIIDAIKVLTQSMKLMYFAFLPVFYWFKMIDTSIQGHRRYLHTLFDENPWEMDGCSRQRMKLMHFAFLAHFHWFKMVNTCIQDCRRHLYTSFYEFPSVIAGYSTGWLDILQSWDYWLMPSKGSYRMKLMYFTLSIHLK